MYDNLCHIFLTQLPILISGHVIRVTKFEKVKFVTISDMENREKLLNELTRSLPTVAARGNGRRKFSAYIVWPILIWPAASGASWHRPQDRS